MLGCTTTLTLSFTAFRSQSSVEWLAVSAEGTVGGYPTVNINLNVKELAKRSLYFGLYKSIHHLQPPFSISHAQYRYTPT